MNANITADDPAPELSVAQLLDQLRDGASGPEIDWTAFCRNWVTGKKWLEYLRPYIRDRYGPVGDFIIGTLITAGDLVNNAKCGRVVASDLSDAPAR